MKTATKATKTPRVTVTHDWISVDFGNGRRLTVSHAREKATGDIPDSVWKKWCSLRDQKGSYLTKIGAFVRNIRRIWPDWDKAPKSFKVGQRVTANFGPRRGNDSGVITKQNRTTYSVRFDRMGLVSCPAYLLK